MYYGLSQLSFPPFSVFPEYVKGGGGHDSDDGEDTAPSSDITLIVSVVEDYNYDTTYSDYELFLEDLFDAMDGVGAGPCMDDHDTDPHMSMARGVKFKSSYHEQQYMYTVNLEVAVWQAMYPNGVVIGSNSKAAFPPEDSRAKKRYVGYGNLYFFFDRANITKAYPPNRDLYSEESYYSKLYGKGGASQFYKSVTTIGFDYSGSGDSSNYEHNPYNWKATMAKHDMTDGWDLPPNCNMEGETFFGIPLSRSSASKLTGSSTFQEQFDFEVLLDRNFTYMEEFGTNHGWLVGEQIGNGAGSIVDKDTAHIPLFYTGTTNPDMGGMDLSDLVKLAEQINFGALYIKPAFVFQDDDASLKLQFEADPNSALAYLYNNLCSMIGIPWNYEQPYNDLGLYTNCAMHAAGDRAQYGCGPNNANSGGFCPQMTLAYRVGFQSDDHAAAYFDMVNSYVDFWRQKFPSGVAVGTSEFCPDGGCLGLFLNRYDLYNVYKPDLGGSWVEYNGGTFAPTISPAPTFEGGCKNPANKHLDRCFRKNNKGKNFLRAVWRGVGAIGHFAFLLMLFMSATLTVSLLLAKAKKKKKKRETYLQYFARALKKRAKKMKKLKSKKSKKKSKKKRIGENMAANDMKKHSMIGSETRSKKRRQEKEQERRRRSYQAPAEPDNSGRSRSKSKSRSRSNRAVYDNNDERRRSRSRSKSRARSRSKSISRQQSSSSAKQNEGGNLERRHLV